MKVNTTQPFGLLAPYIITAAVVFPHTGVTARVSGENTAEALVFVDIVHHQTALSTVKSNPSDLKAYSWDLSRPELTPYSFVHIAHEDAFETYEPFIASEGWREVSVLEGSFQIEEEARPSAFFDEYDLSAIALYGRKQ